MKKTLIKEVQGRARIKNDKSILKRINDISFEQANYIITELCENDVKFSIQDINFILNSKEKQLVATFFDEYKYFTKSNLIHIQSFINKNLLNENKDFVSDLIYFARDFGLDLDYKTILSFLIIKEEDFDCLVLACLEYINLNFKFLFVEELIQKLEYINENSYYHQNEQVVASFILYRITHRRDYLLFLKYLINFDSTNFNYFKRMLRDKPFEKQYFNTDEILKNLNINEI